MDRIVALKVLPPGKTKDQSFVESFLTEARNAGRLNHPNLIRVHEVGRWNDLYYYSMEYVEGVTLLDLMDEFEGGRLDAKRAINIFMQVAAALDHGFRMNIIHREIRPNSVMITEGDQAKLDGLGMTRDETTRFLEGENAYYVAPEQAKNGNVDTRSDLYCLGCTLYHALTGEPPFQGGGPKEILGRRLLAEVPNPLDVNEEIPKDLAAVCVKMMARDPQARFQTPNELTDAFKKILAASFQTGAQKPTTKGPKVLMATRPRVHASRRGGLRRRRR
jgi:serine/threonine-protein kinase